MEHQQHKERRNMKTGVNDGLVWKVPTAAIWQNPDWETHLTFKDNRNCSL